MYIVHTGAFVLGTLST